MKEKCLGMKKKIARFAVKTLTTVTMLSLNTTAMIANAGGWSAGNQSPESIIGAIVDTIVQIFPLVGIFFIVSGIFKTVMAYRNDQPDAMTAGAKDAVIGVVLVVFRLFVWGPIKTAIGM